MKKNIQLVLNGIVGIMIGTIIGAVIEKHTYKYEQEEWKKISDKHLELFLMMNQWTKIKQNGNDIVSYFSRNGYKSIAIYGMSYVGETLLNDLKGTEIQVVYGIDKNAEGIYADIDVVTGEKPLEEVDAVIVTAISYFNEIKEKLETKIVCPIISLKDIIYNI